MTGKFIYRSFEYVLEEISKDEWSVSCDELSFNAKEKSRNWAVLTAQGKIDLYYKGIIK